MTISEPFLPAKKRYPRDKANSEKISIQGGDTMRIQPNAYHSNPLHVTYIVDDPDPIRHSTARHDTAWHAHPCMCACMRVA